MRILFLLLLFTNLGFFAYHHYLGETDEAAAQIARLQVSPEKIILVPAETVSSVAPAALLAPAAASPQPVSATCIEWGPFAGPDAVRADTALAALALPAGSTQRRLTEIDGYWVHMPPLKTKGDVDRKLGELKALGIAEFFVVQETGQWRNAVSLGLFKNEDAARAELDRLRERGVRSAMVTRREKFLKQVAFFVREPSAAAIAQLTALQGDFPGAEFRTGSCPPGMPATS